MRIAYMILVALLSSAFAEAGEAGGSPKPRLDPAPQPGLRRKEPNASSSAAPGSAAPTPRALRSVAPAAQPAATPAAPGAAERTGPAPTAIEHDTVILTNEQHFLGTVLTDQPDPAWVAINTGSGVMRIPRERVARVEYGLTARMGKVKVDDLAALVDLAMWCRANGRNAQALVLLTKAVTLAGCDLKTRGLYAQLIDEQDGADKALPLYIAYRNAGGTEPEIIARLGELETARTAWEEQMRALGLDTGATDSGAPRANATPSSVEEGYEKYKWDSDSLDWSSPAKPTLVTLVTPEGPRRVMQVDVEPHPSKPDVDKAAIVLRRPLALRSGAKLTMLVANRGTSDLRLGIAVKSGAEWTYFESKPQSVAATQTGQEFTQLSFDLGASDFKTQASGWAHSARIANLEQVRELQILLHNGTKSGSVWIAGIAFEGGE